MESIWSWIDDDESHKAVLIGGVTILVLGLTMDALGINKYISTVSGRLRVKHLASLTRPEVEDAKVSQLFIYPVKSLRATALDSAAIDDKGFADDRRFMLVAPRPPPLVGSFGPEDATHQFITQRQVPTLATVQAEFAQDGSLILSSHLIADKTVKVHPKKQRAEDKVLKARIWDDVTEVVDMGDKAAAFLSEIVKKDSNAQPTAASIRLVAIHKEDRFASAKYTPRSALSWMGAAPKVGLTDGFPVLIANEASLEELNRRLEEKGKESIPMSRFRPNIVISGAKPFDEDNWRIISIGDAVFHLVKGCPRCKQSCTDQVTGKVSEEPLETLAEFRALGPVKENVYFAQNAIPHDSGATLRVGAPVRVLERGDPIWDS